MVWPDEQPELQPAVSPRSLTVIHDPEPVPGIPDFYRCLIEFGDFTKTAEIVGIPTTDQYAAEAEKEESYHKKQWLGQVPDDQGGQGDCFTAKGIKWMVGWVGDGPWDTYASTPEEASIEAQQIVAQGEAREFAESSEIAEADKGFVELRAKAYAGYNAAFKYHCCYESLYGPNPPNHHHPAY